MDHMMSFTLTSSKTRGKFALALVHKQSENVKHKFLKALYNRHFTKGRIVVENVFGILLLKNNLHTLFLLDVVTCCYLLYNTIFDGRDVDVYVLI